MKASIGFYMQMIEKSSAWGLLTLSEINEMHVHNELIGMSAKKRHPNEERCGLCTKVTRYLAEFNDVLLCARCFAKEITTFAEGKSFRMRVAIA